MARGIVFLLALLFAAENALALSIAPPTGHINDRAGMLDAATATQLENFLTNFERSDSTQIVVLTVPNLAGQPLEAFSLAVAEQWGIGQKGKDNGALLFIARDERRIRIEVGYGLEGRLTDLTAGQIIRNVITPAFRQGDFNLGVTRGVEAMVSAVKGEYQASGNGAVKLDAGSDYTGILIFLVFGSLIIGRIFTRPLAAIVGGGFSFWLGWIVFGGFSLLLLLVTVAGAIAGFLASAFAQQLGGHGRSGRGGFGGFGGGFGGSGGGGFGSFGGGGFSGGGGGFGGGGASGGW